MPSLSSFDRERPCTVPMPEVTNSRVTAGEAEVSAAARWEGRPGKLRGLSLSEEPEELGFHPEVSGSSPSQALAVSEHLLTEAGSLGSADLLFSTISNAWTRQGFCMQMFWINKCQSFTSPCPVPLKRNSRVDYVLDLTHLNGLFCLGA